MTAAQSDSGAAATAVVAGAVQTRPDGLAGNAASPAALKKISKALRSASPSRAGIGHLKAALEAVRARDFATATNRALAALKLDERNGLGWHILAICREKSGDLVQALAAYDAALKLLPDETDVAHDLGRLAQRLGYLEIAEKLFLRTLAKWPGHIEATNNLACVQRDQNRYAEAIETLRAMIQIHPESPILWNTLGTVLSDQGEMAQSLTFFDEALRLDPDFAKARYNRANARMALGHRAESLADIEIALPGAADDQEVATMVFARALTRIMMGDLEGGFEDYEARFSPSQRDSLVFFSPGERWAPETDLAGRTLLVFGEQGLGDEVLFANVLPDVLEALGPDGRLILAVEPRLVSLFQRSFPTALVTSHRTMRQAGRMLRAPVSLDDAPEPDVWAPIASLFRRFRRLPETFPEAGGFLTPDPARVAFWREALDGLGEGPKIGVVWKSLKLEGSRSRYFAPFDLWRGVMDRAGATFVSLQYGDCAVEMEIARETGLNLVVPPGIDLKDDLDDLAALTSALDLMIGPPNAATNIAGACGAPLWIITTPDAWPQFGTDRYPGYPQARALPTDGFADWQGVMTRLGAELDDYIAGNSA